MNISLFLKTTKCGECRVSDTNLSWCGSAGATWSRTLLNGLTLPALAHHYVLLPLLSLSVNGPGTQTLDTGGRFSGGFRHGAWHGLGIFLGEDGSQFEGSWVGGAQHGPGKLTTAGGDVVEGCWLDNVQTGYGASWNREGKLLHMGRYENGPRQVCPIPRSALPAATHLNKQGRSNELAGNNCARAPPGPVCAVRSRRNVDCSCQRGSAVR